MPDKPQQKPRQRRYEDDPNCVGERQECSDTRSGKEHAHEQGNVQALTFITSDGGKDCGGQSPEEQNLSENVGRGYHAAPALVLSL
jgi:hypothetical protein